MDIRQLRYFVAIAEERAISRAAERVGVAQPSLSQHVMRLEEELQTQLLVRDARGVVLTETGALLLAHARQILKYVDLAREEIRHHGTEARGQVSVALPGSIGQPLSVPLVQAAEERLPGVSLRIVEGMSGHIERWVEDGQVDIGFIFSVGHVRHLSVRKLLTEDLYLILPPSASRGAVGANGILSDPVPLSAIAGMRLILPSVTHGLRDLIDRSTRAAGLTFRVQTEIDALPQIKKLVELGSGVSILSLAAVHDELCDGRLVAARLVDPSIQRSVHLVRHPGRVVTRASLEVEALLLDVMRSLVKRGMWMASMDETDASCAK